MASLDSSAACSPKFGFPPVPVQCYVVLYLLNLANLCNIFNGVFSVLPDACVTEYNSFG